MDTINGHAPNLAKNVDEDTTTTIGTWQTTTSAAAAAADVKKHRKRPKTEKPTVRDIDDAEKRRLSRKPH